MRTFLFAGLLLALPVFPPARAAFAAEPSLVACGGFTDSLTGRQWSVFQDPAHPGGPRIAAPTQPGALASSARGPSSAGRGPLHKAALSSTASHLAVRSGQRVVLWYAGPDIAIRITGVALANARVGQRVGVRRPGGGRPLTGIVRGPGTVEFRFPEIGGNSGVSPDDFAGSPAGTVSPASGGSE